MTSLSDKVARVKERMKQAEPYREIWSDEFHVIDQQNAIIQKQREVLVMAREAVRLSQLSIEELREQGSPCAYWDDVEKQNLDALTAIDNVMKGEGV